MTIPERLLLKKKPSLVRQKSAIPLDRLKQAALQIILRLPAKTVACLRGREVLRAYLASRAIMHVRLKMLAIHDALKRTHQFHDRERSLCAEVESLARHMFIIKTLGQKHVGARHILDVDILAYELPVASDDGALTAQT